jgi:hypothetical protein
MRAWLAALLIGLYPGAAAAQALTSPSGAGAPPPRGIFVPPSTSALLGRPNDFPHPSQTWNFLSPYVYPRPESIRALGQAIRHFEVPARQVAIPVPATIAQDGPLAWTEQLVTIPGYYVTETTTGYIYPERWTVEQLNVGVYGWRLLPAEFLRK